MARRWVLLNVVLLVIDLIMGVQIVRALSTVRPLPRETEVKAPAAADAIKEEPAPPRPALPTFSVIATRNLFNASRNENLQASTSGQIAPPPKLILQGVIVTDSGRVAYLEDPSTKRTHGYRVGDSAGGGRIEQIEFDRVVISRPEGPFDVLLHDPTRVKPAAAGAQTAPTPTVQAPAPGAVGPLPPPPIPPPGRPATPGFLRRPGGIPIQPQQGSP